MGRADDHVHHADFVLNLTDHDAELPRVLGHPHQHAGRWAHRIGRVKFHARRRAAHRGGLVAGDDAQRLCANRCLPRECFEILRGIFVTGPGDGDVPGHDLVALLLELPGDDRFERLRFNPEQLERGAERGGVDRELVALGQVLHRHRAKLHAVGGLTGHDFFAVVNRAGAGLQQTQVAIHRVLVERDEDVDLVPHVAHRRVARPNGQESVPAANDRLVGVVGVEVEPAPREDAGENIPGGGDALTVLATDADCEIHFGEFCHLIIGRSLCWTERASANSNIAKFSRRRLLRNRGVLHPLMPPRREQLRSASRTVERRAVGRAGYLLKRNSAWERWGRLSAARRRRSARSIARPRGTRRVAR